MSYYPTLDEDLQRAKAILERGKTEPPDLPMPEHVNFGGTISGGDTYAAYQLLESFVAAIARLQTDYTEAVRFYRERDATAAALHTEVGRLRAEVEGDADTMRLDREARDAALAEVARLQQLLAANIGVIEQDQRDAEEIQTLLATAAEEREQLLVEVARLRADAERERAARQVVDEALRQAHARLADLDDRGAGWAGQ